MEQKYFEGVSYKKADFTKKPLPAGSYENCIFDGCDFSGTDLSNIKFTDCEFIVCNLSLAKLNNTALRDIKFHECKMLGLLFDNCNKFGFSVSFTNCILNHSSFYQVNIKGAKFIHTQLQEVDFTESDLSGAVFDNCNLDRAIFQHTLLEKSDFSTAYGYAIDPEVNRLKKAKFSKAGLTGLLYKYDLEIID